MGGFKMEELKQQNLLRIHDQTADHSILSNSVVSVPAIIPGFTFDNVNCSLLSRRRLLYHVCTHIWKRRSICIPDIYGYHFTLHRNDSICSGCCGDCGDRIVGKRGQELAVR